MKRINFWIDILSHTELYGFQYGHGLRDIDNGESLVVFCKQRLLLAIEDYTASECEKAQEWVISDLACKGVDYYGI